MILRTDSKRIHFFLLCSVLVLLLASELYSQKKTIILVRHAEKDAVQSEMSGDPALSVAGKERAERLVTKIKKYRPGAVYSTDYIRTRDTAAPMAKRRKLQIQIYDAKKPNELIDQVLKSRTKRFLIVGHSNTIPELANLLIKKDLFQSLDENEYGTIWLIRIKSGGVVKVELLEY